MSLIVKNPKTEYEVPDEGPHHAVITDIRDLGTIQTKYGPMEKLLFIFDTDQRDSVGKPIRVFKRYTKTLHPKSALRKLIRSLTGTDPGDEFDVAEFVGLAVQVVIELQRGDGCTYANVTAVTRVKTEQPPHAARSTVAAANQATAK